MNDKTIIGLEIHVQLKTESKMFCGCDNKAEEAAPNTLVCPVCLGLPGVLPVANKQAIEWTLKTGMALNANIAKESKFDRKHYFYPDLPKNYQISQYDLPFCLNGKLEIRNEKLELKEIPIRRIHLEEDAGKLIHTKDASLVDLNRAGTPLMEIVTEPKIESPSDAKILMQELRSILRYLSVSDANMEKGHLRCDANISLETDGKEGTPVEIKNMNSFRMVERALAYEEKRQKELLAKGEKIVKETRGWNDANGETYSQRSKEFAQDYRYFPEPDIPPFNIEGFDLEKIKKEIPELPAEKRKRFISDLKNEKDYSSSVHNAAIEALIKEPILEDYYLYFAEKGLDKLFALMFVTHQMWGKLATGTMPDQFHKEAIFDILKDWWDKKITNIKAKEIFELSLKSPERVRVALKESEIKFVGNELERLIDEVVKENEKSVSDYCAGKKEALGFLIGQVMKKTKGQANPSIVRKILEERIK